MLANLSLTTKVKILLLLLLLLTVATSFKSNFLYAHEYQQDGIFINHPYSSPTRPGTNNGVMYIVNIENLSKTMDKLTSVTTSIAESSEIHTMKNINGVMKMRKISSINLPLNQSISLKKGNPDGYHIMLLGIKQKLQNGDNFDAILHFENAPSIKVNVEVIESKVNHKH